LLNRKFKVFIAEVQVVSVNADFKLLYKVLMTVHDLSIILMKTDGRTVRVSLYVLRLNIRARIMQPIDVNFV